jgi:hypothetical protein
MAVRLLLLGSLVGVFVLTAVPPATGQPAPNRCTALFALSDVQGAMASADLKNDGLERLYVEMGPARAALITEGAGVSGAYKVQTSELTYWHYMSIYEPAKAWLTPGSVRLFYSGFRVGWPELRLGGKVVNKLKLTVTHGDQSMTIDVDPDAEGAVINSRVIAIDQEDMLVGAYPAARVDDHRAWRQAADQQRAISITLTDASNGQVMARGEAARLAEDSMQALLSGGLNALREKYNEGRCD